MAFGPKHLKHTIPQSLGVEDESNTVLYLESYGNQPQLSLAWTPKVCKIMAFWAVFSGFGPLFYILWGSRWIVILVMVSIAGLISVKYGLPESLVGLGSSPVTKEVLCPWSLLVACWQKLPDRALPIVKKRRYCKFSGTL